MLVVFVFQLIVFLFIYPTMNSYIPRFNCSFIHNVNFEKELLFDSNIVLTFLQFFFFICTRVENRPKTTVVFHSQTETQFNHFIVK